MVRFATSFSLSDIWVPHRTEHVCSVPISLLVYTECGGTHWESEDATKELHTEAKRKRKRTNTTESRELSHTVLARTRKKLGGWSLWMDTGIPVIVDWQPRAKTLLVLRSSSSVLMYLRYPRRGLNCTSQASGYNHEAQAFLAQYTTIKPTGNLHHDHPFETPTDARAFVCPAAQPAEIISHPRTTDFVCDTSKRFHCYV